MRHWVQLIWNPEAARLERVAYSVWDPVPSLGLDLQWVPDDARAGEGIISGKGTLTFRRPHAPTYDTRANVASYRGSIVDGHFEGLGRFVDTSGYSYEGQWRRGLMDGEGRQLLANGEEYVGRFRAGLRHGEGVLTEATGRSYRGGFDMGVPRASRMLAQATEDIRVGIIAERHPSNDTNGIPVVSYTSRSEGEVLKILPDDERLLDLWRGGGPIDVTPDEFYGITNEMGTPSLLGSAERYGAASLVFEIENTTAQTISLVGGYLDVATSRPDPEPAMQLRPIQHLGCAGTAAFLPYFYVDNFGWTDAENARLVFQAAAPDGRTGGPVMEMELGNISSTVLADASDRFRELGVDTDYLGTTVLQCTDPGNSAQCAAELRDSGRFGALADYISFDYNMVRASIAGTLEYDWAGTDGVPVSKSSPFTVAMPIATVAQQPECGSGGEVSSTSDEPFLLEVDKSNYRVSIPFAGDVTPGFTARWRIALQAPQTSQHDFRLVFLTDDRRQIESRPVHLTYFMPPTRQLELAPAQ